MLLLSSNNQKVMIKFMHISLQVFPPGCLLDNPINAVTTKFVRTSTNKLRCPIFCVAVSTLNLGNFLCVLIH